MNNGAKNGYLMVALGASNQVHHCWTKKDYEPSLQAIEYIYNELLHDPIKKTKLYLLGISSGGYFISIIAKQILRNNYNLSAVCLQISSLMMNSVQRIPSPLFIYMEKDINLAENIIGTQEDLSLHNIDTAKYAVKSKQINEAFLQYYNIPQADLIVQSLLAANYIDKTTGLLLEDPRSSRWREVVTNAVPTIKTYDSLVADDSALSEIFNLAYAYHEITDEYADGMFKWFASH
jgi:carboxypeptidase C (cathepsin A)